MPRRIRQARQRFVLDLQAENALVACPPPWEPIDPETDEYVAGLVEANLPLLLARQTPPRWPLVRYAADPDLARDLVDRYRSRLLEQIDAPILAPWRQRHLDELEALDRWAQGR
jgi:hypothetical protein